MFENVSARGDLSKTNLFAAAIAFDQLKEYQLSKVDSSTQNQTDSTERTQVSHHSRPPQNTAQWLPPLILEDISLQTQELHSLRLPDATAPTKYDRGRAEMRNCLISFLDRLFGQASKSPDLLNLVTSDPEEIYTNPEAVRAQLKEHAELLQQYIELERQWNESQPSEIDSGTEAEAD